MILEVYPITKEFTFFNEECDEWLIHSMDDAITIYEMVEGKKLNTLPDLVSFRNGVWHGRVDASIAGYHVRHCGTNPYHWYEFK